MPPRGRKPVRGKIKGDLEIRVSPEDVGGIYEVLQSAGLMQRRGEFHGLKKYIEANFDQEIKR